MSYSAADANGNSAHFDFSVIVTAASTPAPATPVWLTLLLGLSLLGLTLHFRKPRQAKKLG